MPIPGDPKGIDIVPDSLVRKCRCSTNMGSLKVKIPEDVKKSGTAGRRPPMLSGYVRRAKPKVRAG